MISIYIHVPFCATKCNYCNFFSMSGGNNLTQTYISGYVDSMISQLQQFASILGKKSIKTIYFGGGNPLFLGIENIKKIVENIGDLYDLSHIEEISIELNPDPSDQVLAFVSRWVQIFDYIPRVRTSFGIQSLDDKVLSASGRRYSFSQIQDFTKKILAIKKGNMIYNLDFISFGMGEWGGEQMLFFKKLLEGHQIDSYSLYTLELFDGSTRYKNFEISEDNIYNEFDILKNLLISHGYNRYEISNFALEQKESIHNNVYRNMGSYLGIGAGASGFLYTEDIDVSSNDILGAIGSEKEMVRYTNTQDMHKYLSGKYIDTDSIKLLDGKDLLIESFFLGLRTARGIQSLDRFVSILVSDYEYKIAQYQNSGFVLYENGTLILTDKGMDVYNSIVTELLGSI